MTRIERMRALVRRLCAVAHRQVKGRQVTGRQWTLAGAGVVAALLALGAALPAGAKTQVTVGVASGASITLKPSITFKAGPVTFTGNFQARAPRTAASVGYFSGGHFIIGQPYAAQPYAPQPYAGRRQALAYAPIYGCPPYSLGVTGYGMAGYAVPLYDYRADRFARPRQAYGYGYNRRVAAAAPRQARQETLGTFNLPAGYVEIGLTETPRPSFEPRIVQLAGTKAPSGKLPTVHKPAGKNHIHIE